jgi:hypothetical protein
MTVYTLRLDAPESGCVSEESPKGLATRGRKLHQIKTSSTASLTLRTIFISNDYLSASFSLKHPVI